jgi:hypothetical protein
MNKLRGTQTFVLAALVCLQVSIAVAQEPAGHRVVPLDPKGLEVHDHADRVYRQTDYERAFVIYRNELAEMGDKYGQYMVGYMYLTGKGVEEDWVAASAWYRLAAERGNDQLLAVSDKLWLSLDAEQQAQSDERFLQLRKKFGDLALVMKATRDDCNLLRSRTGSRLGNSTSALTVIDPNNATASGLEEDYYGPIEDRVLERLKFVALYTGIEIVVDDPRRFDMAGLERQVDEFLDELN